MAPENKMIADGFCQDHLANVQRLERLEDDRRDHASKMDKITNDLTECVVEIREASISLRSFVDKFSQVTQDCNNVNAHVEENRKRIDTLETSVPEKLNNFEARIERKIEILAAIGAVILACIELFVHFK